MARSQAQVRTFGIWRATSLVVGNIVGTGILMLPASLGAFGPLGLLGWLVTCIGSMCLALVFARLSSLYPQTGGPYVYCREAFGDFAAFQMAWCYWAGCWAGNAAIAVAFVGYLSYFWEALQEQTSLQFLVAAFAVWFFTALNVLSLRNTGIAQVVFAVLKIVPLVVIGTVGIAYIDTENYFPINPSEGSWLQVISATSALTLYAFMGFESATIPADNVADPGKTIPRATVLGTLFSAVIYIWTSVVLMGIMPSAKLAQSHAPFADAAMLIFGAPGASLIAICAIVAAFGTLNGWILLQGQLPLAAARDGFFPEQFAKLSRFSTPAFGLIFSSVLLTGVLYLNYGASLVDHFTSIVTLTTFTLLLPYIFSAAADIKFLLEGPSPRRLRTLARPALVSSVALGYSLIAAYGAGREALQLCILFVFLGFPAYVLMKRKPLKT